MPSQFSTVLKAELAAATLLLASILGHPRLGECQTPPRPRPVRVSLLVNSISDIDSSRETFRADVYVTLRWRDPALQNVDPETVDWSKTLRPSIEFMNSQDAEPMGEGFLQVEPGGVGFSETRHSGTFSSNLDLEDFPFDEQVLTFSLESQNETADKMVFFVQLDEGVVLDVQDRPVPLRKGAIFGHEIHLPEWDITGVDVREFKSSFHSDQYSHLQFSVRIARRVGYYVMKVMSVLVMLVVLSWAVFLFDPADLGNRMAVTITLFLAAVAFAFVTGSLIPRISYLTLLDTYLLGCYVLLFLTAIESLIVHQLRDESRARRIDRLALWCFPATFLLLHLLVWVRA